MDTKSGEHFVSLAEVLRNLKYDRKLHGIDIILRINDEGEVNVERVLLRITSKGAVTARIMEYSSTNLAIAYSDTFTWNITDKGGFIFGNFTGVKVNSIRLTGGLIQKMQIIIEAERLPLSYLGW